MKEEGLRKNKNSGDFLLLLLVLGLTIFGLIMVFSASYYNALSKAGNPYKYLIEDAKWVLLGWCGFIFFYCFDYHMLKKLALPGLVVGFVALGLIFTPLGYTTHGATRWLDFKLFTVMPGEIIKPVLIVFIAWFFSEDPSRIRSITKGVLPVLGIAVAAFALIYKQPNLSTAGIVLLLAVGMLFVSGLSIKLVLATLGTAIASFIAIMLAPQFKHIKVRATGFLDPFATAKNEGYQVVQSLLALGSGGVRGVGLGKSVQKTLYLPEAQNDFIVAVIGEELGYIGILLLMAVYLVLIWRCCTIAVKAEDYFGMLLVSGVTILLSLQVVLNIAVVTASFFPTGIFLPFVSLGGNGTLVFLALMGIVANVSRQQSEHTNLQSGGF